MRQFFADIEWEDLLVRKNEQEAWDEFQEILEEAMDKFIPVHNSSGRRKTKHQSYMDRSGLRMVKSKNRA